MLAPESDRPNNAVTPATGESVEYAGQDERSLRTAAPPGVRTTTGGLPLGLRPRTPRATTVQAVRSTPLLGDADQDWAV